MSFLSFFKKKEEHSLLIDIGNGAITCALVSFAKNRPPKFLYSITKTFLVNEKPDFLRLSKGITSLLGEMLATIVKKSKNLSSVVVSLSSPWFILKSKDISLSQEAIFVISESFLYSIASSEEEIFEKKLAKDFSMSSAGSFSVIEKNIINTKINGYVVENPIGRKTKHFDATIFITAMLKNIEKNVVEVVSKNTHISRGKILLHSFPLVLFSVVRDNFERSSDFMLMNITSELTDLILISNGTITKTASFNFGKSTIIREMAKTLKITPEIAESQLHMYISGKINDSSKSSIKEIFDTLEQNWIEGLKDALTTFSPTMTLPGKVFITTDDDTAPIFIDFLKSEKIGILLDFIKNINITNINKELLLPFYKTEPQIGENEFVVILSLFCDKFFKSQ